MASSHSSTQARRWSATRWPSKRSTRVGRTRPSKPAGSSPAGSALGGQLERLYRTASIITFGGGTNEIQRDIISAAGLWMPRAAR